MVVASATHIRTTCYHGGTDCPTTDETVLYDDRAFCCAGCKTVCAVLAEHQLWQYYDLNPAPGSARTNAPQLDRLSFLDLPDVAAQLIDFQNETVAHVTFFVRAIHCSSCLWLIEHLYRMEPGVVQTRVDFLKKQVDLVFDPTVTGLRAAHQPERCGAARAAANVPVAAV